MTPQKNRRIVSQTGTEFIKLLLSEPFPFVIWNGTIKQCVHVPLIVIHVLVGFWRRYIARSEDSLYQFPHQFLFFFLCAVACHHLYFIVVFNIYRYPNRYQLLPSIVFRCCSQFLNRVARIVTHPIMKIYF